MQQLRYLDEDRQKHVKHEIVADGDDYEEENGRSATKSCHMRVQYPIPVLIVHDDINRDKRPPEIVEVQAR